MDLFSIEWKKSARKELRKLDKDVISRILGIIEGLIKNPYPRGSRKLSGSSHTYRIRVGDYRIVYSVLSSVLTIEIIRIGHRKEIYRRFN
jgi:mRNA interferase RelE/StbE